MIARRRPLTLAQRYAKAPLGLLYLLLLALLSAPVMVYMTLLWGAARGAAALAGVLHLRRRARGDSEERAA